MTLAPLIPAKIAYDLLLLKYSIVLLVLLGWHKLANRHIIRDLSS